MPGSALLALGEVCCFALGSAHFLPNKRPYRFVLFFAFLALCGIIFFTVFLTDVNTRAVVDFFFDFLAMLSPLAFSRFLRSFFLSILGLL